MSDLDSVYDPTDFIERDRRRIAGEAVAALPDDPAQAARAYQLGRATNNSPALIYPDVENFETQHRAALTSNLLNNNSWLREYLDGDPMRAKLSADDWANLDDVTTKLEGMRKYTGFPQRVAGGAIEHGIEGFKKGFGEGPIGEWVTTVPFLKDNRAAQAIWAASGTPIEAMFRILSGGIHGATEAAYSITKDLTGDEQAAKDFAGMIEMQLTGTGVHGAGKAVGDTAKYADAIGRAKPWLDAGREPPPGLHPEIDKIKEKQNVADVKRLEEATQAAEASVTRQRDPQTFADLVRLRDRGAIEIDGEAVLRLYGDKVPSIEDGLIGWAPRLGEQLELARASGGDISIPLADWLAHADGDLMKLLRDDIRVRPGGITKNEALRAKGADNAEINAEREAAAAPVADSAREAVAEGVADGKEQSRAALGGEVGAGEGEVARDPVTEEFLKAKRKAEVIPEDLPAARAAAGLEPLFSVGDRKATLKRVKQEQNYTGDTQFHDFEILNEHSEPVGFVNLSTAQGGKQLYIEMIQAGADKRRYDPNFLGPSLIRDLLRQLKREFPEAESITGHRVSGAREKAGSFMEDSASPVVKLSENELQGWDSVEPMRELLKGTWQSKGSFEIFRGEKTLDQAVLTEAVDRAVRKIAPLMLGEVQTTPADLVKRGGSGTAGGAYQRFHNDIPTILVSLEGTNPAVGIGRHEAIHHLRKYGFFDATEWQTLERAAREEGWLEKHGIGTRRYMDQPMAAKLEEAIAEEYRTWATGRETSARAKPIFERMKEFFEAIRTAIKELLGKDLSWEEIFKQVEEGKVGGREGTQPLEEGGSRPFTPEPAFSENQPELPGTTRMEDRPLFRTPGTIGMTARQADLYAKRLREMHESDIEWSTKRAEREQRKTLTAEWKTEKKNVQSEVEADFDARPDVAADIYFARGELFGEKVERLKIDREDLKALEIDPKSLPRDYIAKPDGAKVELDDLASLVGYPTGRALVEDLVQYNAAKLTANMSAKAFRDRLIDLEVQRRMTERFGDLEENILDHVKDQIAGETQLNLIAEETLALGIKAGAEASINKAELREWIKERFEDSPMAGESSEKYLRASGKAGTAAELGLLKEKFDEAYRAKQQQYMAMTLMREARVLEREQKQFAKLAKRLGKREVKGLDQEFHDWITDLMIKAGVPSRRNMLEVQRSQAITGTESFPDFVQRITGDGWEPMIGEDLLAGRVKPMEAMTVGEFRDFKDAIDSLNYIGRQVDKINIEGEKRDFAEWRKGVIENIQTRPQRSREAQESLARSFIFRADAELTRVENWLKELDLGEEMGPLVNTVIRPMAEAKHKEYSLQEKLAKDIKELPQDRAWKKTLDQTLPNDWFKDPSTGEPFKLTRGDLIGIMLNFGNRSNIRKFSRGYGSSDPTRGATRAEADAFEARMRQFIDQHATKQDWDFVQGVWGIYKGFQKDMEVVWRNTSGTQPRLVEPVPYQSPHGTFEGGYYPLLRDWYLSGTPKGVSDRALFGPDYPNYSTPQGHLKERTGASYFVDFRQDIGMIPIRMQQVMHDIAYRDAVMAAQKVISDKQIMAAIRQHYGAEYEKQLRPWLERIAKGATMDEKNLSFRDKILRQTRMNLINYALPLNYVVTLTPDVGAPKPAMMVNYLRDRTANVALAERWSKEIPHAIYNMDRDFREAMQRAVGEGKIDTAKQKAVLWGYQIVSSVSREFRRATWLDEFTKATEKGHDEAKAAAIADSYVRERHGSAALADLPPIMAGGEAGRLLTMFYGYWNTQFNWLRTVKGDVQRGEYMKALETAYGTIIIGSIFGAAIANQAREEDSAAKRLAKAVPTQLLGMMPYGVREFGTYLVEGIPPNTPLGSLIKATGAAGRDVVKAFRKEPVDKGVRHATAAAGMLLGIPGTLQIGRSGQGLYDVAVGRQRPRDIFEWTRLLATGEARLKRQGER